MNILELKELRAGKLVELNALIQGKETRADKAYTADEEVRFDAIEAEVNKLDTQIERAEKEEKIAKRNAKSPEPAKTPEDKVADRFSFSEAVRQAQAGKLTGLYKELDEEGRREASASNIAVGGNGIYIPEMALRADAQNTATVSDADGGFLVGTDKQGFIPNLYDKTILGRMGVQRMNGLKGNIEMPEETGVVSASWETEVAAVETQKAAFGQKTMSPKRLAVSAAYSSQLLIQSNPSIDRILMSQISAAFEQKLDDTFINGATGLEGLIDVTGTITDGAVSYAMLLEILEKGFTGNLEGLSVVSSAKVMTELMATYLNDQGTGAPLLQGERLATGNAFYASNKVSDIKGTGTNDSDIFAIDPSTIAVGSWGGLSLIADPYTGANEAKTKLHVNAFFDIKNLRPAKGYKGLVTRP